MNAVISGTAGQALLIDGESLKSFDVQGPSNLVVRRQADLPYLFGEGRDLRFIEDTDLDSIVNELKSESNLSLALDLTLISLDEELEEDIRTDAIRDLHELLVDAELGERLEGIMYARPLPEDDADLSGALSFCNKSSLANSFALLTDLDRRQGLVSKVRAAWDVIPTKVFGGHEQKTEFQRVAVQRGLFRSLVIIIEKSQSVSNFLLTAGLDNFIRHLHNYRQVLQAWSAPFKEGTESRIIRSEVEEEEPPQTKHRRKRGRRIDIKRQAVLNEVNRRKAIISAAIQRRDIEIVQGLTTDLIDYQLHRGETEHLAKSLCDLAMEAKELGMFLLQLELTERSINAAPDDSWSWAQHADALLNNGKLEDALHAYAQAESFGEVAFGKRGRGEILKLQGRFDEAVAAFDEVIADNPEDLVAKCGRAEVLKAQGDLDLSLAAYNKIVCEHPEDIVAKASRASVLKAKGELEAALAAYNEVLAYDPDHLHAKNARADILKTQGRFDAALGAYNEIVVQHPEDLVAKNGRADVLKTKGELDEALAGYEQVIKLSPENGIARRGRVTILAATGRYQQALAALRVGIPVTLDDWIEYHILGMIRLRTGKTTEAIRIFDDGARNNPWPSSREYFSRALALAWLRGRDFQKASKALDDVTSPLLQPVTNVLRIHAFGAQGKIERANIAYESLATNPDLRSTELTQELHSQFILKNPARKTEEWILDKETEILLLAA